MIVGVLLALIAGCGDGSDEDLTTRRDPGPAPTAGIRDGGPAQEHPEGWGSMEVTVRTLHVADDDRTLTAEVALRPVRMTDGSCVGEVSGSVTDENNPDVV